MKLREYLQTRRIMQKTFAEWMTVEMNRTRAPCAPPVVISQQKVQQLCRADARAPRQQIMAAIYVVTSGLVGPADFYQLPHVERRDRPPGARP